MQRLQRLKKLTYARVYHSRSAVFGHKPTQTKDSLVLAVDQSLVQNTPGNIVQLTTAYQTHGYKKSVVDPLQLSPRIASELDLSLYGIDLTSTSTYDLRGLIYSSQLTQGTVSDLVQYLENVYCGPCSIEAGHVHDEEEKQWLLSAFEKSRREFPIEDEERKQLAGCLIRSQAFDNFLAKKFGHVKRYGAEGAESSLGFIRKLLQLSALTGIQDVVIGMPHRGRLNLLVDVLKFHPTAMFYKMKGNTLIPDGSHGSGDVLSHLVNSVDLTFGKEVVHVTMLPNPSHLEAVCPVAVGKARGRQLSLKEGDYSLQSGHLPGDKVLCLQVHGDASFTGQGIVPETLTLSQVPHFRVGGSIHLLVNNQLGFTTPSNRGRSSLNASDVGKMIGCPVFRVNGDYPEEVIRMCQLAIEYRMKYRRDVIVDLICFRRWGHNELDDPSLTQPLMYNVINSRHSVPDIYVKSLVESGKLSKEFADTETENFNKELGLHLAAAEEFKPEVCHLQKQWASCQESSTKHVSKWSTGCPQDLLKYVGAMSVHVADDTNIHPRLVKSHVESRLRQVDQGVGIDWATAEALAIGSLLLEGFNVRVSGQDVGRGTFSHRHMMIVDNLTDATYVPLNHLHDEHQGYLEVANSPLSEEAVLAFEYGMSIESPQNLIIWEAQFGDFFTGAQIIVDTYISSGESKWLLQSGLVMLLPHGMDGAGPEHSSCRIERFLQLTDSSEDGPDSDNVNMYVTHPTTPCQYFHLLRRQMVRNFRKPLIVASPKLILRASEATSTLQEMAPGTTFHPVLDDEVDAERVKRVVFCSGKHFYALTKHRRREKTGSTAIIRLEELCPFPAEELKSCLTHYPQASEFVWSQEEHRNMGAWSFVQPRFEYQLGIKLRYAGRGPLAAPAVGYGKRHKEEELAVLYSTFAS